MLPLPAAYRSVPDGGEYEPGSDFKPQVPPYRPPAAIGVDGTVAFAASRLRSAGGTVPLV